LIHKENAKHIPKLLIFMRKAAIRGPKPFKTIDAIAIHHSQTHDSVLFSNMPLLVALDLKLLAGRATARGSSGAFASVTAEPQMRAAPRCNKLLRSIATEIKIANVLTKSHAATLEPKWLRSSLIV
jgi:hypothetical protein